MASQDLRVLFFSDFEVFGSRLMMVEMPDLVHNLILRKIFGSIYIVVLKNQLIYLYVGKWNVKLTLYTQNYTWSYD